MGDAFVPGPWTLGRKYRWINPAAIIWVGICVVIFILPFVPAGVPFNDDFAWSSFNYAPVTVGIVVLAVGLWWQLGAKNTFEGPIREIQVDDTGRVVEDKPREEVTDLGNA